MGDVALPHSRDLPLPLIARQHYNGNTFVMSSSKWLITFIAIRPVSSATSEDAGRASSGLPLSSQVIECRLRLARHASDDLALPVESRRCCPRSVRQSGKPARCRRRNRASAGWRYSAAVGIVWPLRTVEPMIWPSASAMASGSRPSAARAPSLTIARMA